MPRMCGGEEGELPTRPRRYSDRGLFFITTTTRASSIDPFQTFHFIHRFRKVSGAKMALSAHSTTEEIFYENSYRLEPKEGKV